jgi:hypothetical protein
MGSIDGPATQLGFRRRIPWPREHWWRWLACIGRTHIDFTADPRAAFVDELVTLTWRIVCSDCARMDGEDFRAVLQEDLTARSGTAGHLVEANGFLAAPCSLDMSGSTDWIASDGAGIYTWVITARGPLGATVTGWADAAFLPHPRIDACNGERQAAIESAVKSVCAALGNGCIRDTAALDLVIHAFRDGRLTRAEVWERLIDQLVNLQLITFSCVDSNDEDWRDGHWTEFTNGIELQWSPNHEPDLPRVILRELVRKCGFNGDIEPFYGVDDVRMQADGVAGACHF